MKIPARRQAGVKSVVRLNSINEGKRGKGKNEKGRIKDWVREGKRKSENKGSFLIFSLTAVRVANKIPRNKMVE